VYARIAARLWVQQEDLRSRILWPQLGRPPFLTGLRLRARLLHAAQLSDVRHPVEAKAIERAEKLRANGLVWMPCPKWFLCPNESFPGGYLPAAVLKLSQGQKPRPIAYLTPGPARLGRSCLQYQCYESCAYHLVHRRTLEKLAHYLTKMQLARRV
jgi:hypothetical protein